MEVAEGEKCSRKDFVRLKKFIKRPGLTEAWPQGPDAWGLASFNAKSDTNSFRRILLPTDYMFCSYHSQA